MFGTARKPSWNTTNGTSRDSHLNAPNWNSTSSKRVGERCANFATTRNSR